MVCLQLNAGVPTLGLPLVVVLMTSLSLVVHAARPGSVLSIDPTNAAVQWRVSNASEHYLPIVLWHGMSFSIPLSILVNRTVVNL
jgi:hypothetical protein